MKRSTFLLFGLLWFGTHVCEAQRLEMMLDDARQLCEGQRYKQAVDVLERVLNADRTNAVAHYYLARVYWDSEEFRNKESAAKHYQLAKKNGIEFNAPVERITALEEEGMVPLALDSTKEAILVDSISSSCGEELSLDAAVKMLKQTRIDRLVEKERRGEELTHQENCSLRAFEEACLLCKREIEKGQLEGAQEFSKLATSVAQKHWKGYYLMALLSIEQGNSDEARRMWSKVIDIGFTGTSDWEDLNPNFSTIEPIPRVAVDSEEVNEDLVSEAVPLMAEESERDTAWAPSVDIDRGSVLADTISTELLVESELDTIDMALNNTQIGQLLKKQKRGEELTFGEFFSIHVFDVASLMCKRRIQGGLYEVAREFADHVIRVAPDHWRGYYLMTLIYHEQEKDLINADRWWTQAIAHGFNATPQWPEIEMIPVEDFIDFYLQEGRELMEKEKWVEAEAKFIRIFDTPVPVDEEVRRKFAEVYFRLGLISSLLGDCGAGKRNMELGERQGFESSDSLNPLIDRAYKCVSVLDPPDSLGIQKIPRRVLKGYGMVHVDLNRLGFLDVGAQIDMGEGDIEPAEEVMDVSNTFQVQGRGVYRVEVDIRRQLRNMALQGTAFLATLTLLILM